MRLTVHEIANLNTPDRKPARSPFWMLQWIAWPAYGLISFVGALPYIGLSPHLVSVRSVLASKAAFTVAGFVSSSLMRTYYRRQTLDGSWVRVVPLVITFSYLSALAASVCSNAARHVVSGRYLDSGWSSLLGGAVNASAVFLAWSACYFAIRNYRALEEKKRDAVNANALAQRAQLEMLRSQVNPHFLFNALNSVHALVQEDPRRAQIVVEELSDFLRYSLTQSKGLSVPLSEEIEVLEKYLAIEKIRFEEKLLVRFLVQSQSEECRVPGLLLHPLVENAVKYGMQTSAMPLQIRLTAGRDGDSLRVAIANSGRWVAPEESVAGRSSMGLGRTLVRQRLEQAYPGRHQFLTEERDGWVESVIVIKSADVSAA